MARAIFLLPPSDFFQHACSGTRSSPHLHRQHRNQAAVDAFDGEGDRLAPLGGAEDVEQGQVVELRGDSTHFHFHDSGCVRPPRAAFRRHPLNTDSR